MKQTVLYPFKREDIPYILSEKAIYGQYEITDVVAPRGSGLCGKDIAYADNREKTGIMVQENLKECLVKADALLITSGDLDEYYSGLDEAIRLAIEYKKDILCNVKLSVIKKKNLCAHVDEKTLHLSMDLRTEYHGKKSVVAGMYRLKVPVVFVASIYGDANNREVMLKINRQLHKEGYNACMVSATPELQMYDGIYCSILDTIKSGKFIGDSVQTTIKLLNKFFQCIENQKRPDLIIVDVPGGLIDTPFFPNESGVFAYILTRAIQPDYVIGTALHGRFEECMITQISEEIDKRFGFCLNCVHVSNKMLHMSSSLQKMEMEFLYAPIFEMNEDIQKLGDMLVGNYLLNGRERNIVENLIEVLGKDE